MDRQNLTLLTDLYELTMMQGYFKNKEENRTVISIPSGAAMPSCAVSSSWSAT